MITTGARFVSAIAILGLMSCDLPRDPDGATRRVEGGVLRVGVVENPPWASRVGDGAAGAEADLARVLAARLHATPVWTFGPEARLLPGLRRRNLDLVIGGFTADDPWVRTVAATRPFAKVGEAKHVLLAPPGENRWLLTLDAFLGERTRARPAATGAR